jgi:hypothetical protein
MQLERLWNDLGQHHSFALLCAYPLDLFGDGRLAGFWHDVCAAHTSVIPAESYTAVVSQDAKQRSVATLQYKAQLLEAEMAARRQTEAHLRRLLAERDQLLPEGERLLAREHAARTSAAVALPTQRDTAGGVP